MILSFPKIISPGKNTSSPGKEYISTSIDTYNLDYYNVSENHIDYCRKFVVRCYPKRSYKIRKYEKGF